MGRMFPIAILIVVLTLPACHHGVTRPSEQRLISIPKGKVLILPPRDMIQDGVFHAISPGTGKYLLSLVRPRFEEEGWSVLTTDAPEFTSLSVPDVRQSILEGRRENSDYVLRLVLGEFRDAAPMTFRPDFVTLESADLWSTSNAALVWSLSPPLVSSGMNLRTYHRLVDEISEMLVDELTSAEVDSAVFAEKDQLPAASEPAEGGMGSCTVDQVLTMKNSGMTDLQVRRACTK
jgi:hypothetical protein